jgi:hypothetical protein
MPLKANCNLAGNFHPLKKCKYGLRKTRFVCMVLLGGDHMAGFL